MKPFAFILSAGLGSRFRFDLPKQLAFLAGEKVLSRQLRQLNKQTICSAVVTNDPKIIEESECIIRPKLSWTVLHTLESTQRYWSERNHILLGDVFYSTAVMDDILTNIQPIKFWMSGSEIYALSFDGSESYAILEEIKNCLEACNGDCKLWHLYRALAGLELHQPSPVPTGLSGNLVTDHTCDIDSELQYSEVNRMLDNLQKSGIVL